MFKLQNETKDKYFKSWIISICIFLNIIAFVVVGNLLFFRLDMTFDKSYSVSQPTVQLLNRIDPKTPMIIEYYYLDKCKEFAWMKQVVQYVIDMLKEYEVSSKGSVNVIIRELNYEKNRAEIDKLERQGFQSFQLRQTLESEEKSFLGYSGIIIKYKNNQNVMPVVYMDTGFEYNLDVQIKKLVVQDSGKVGLLFAAGDTTFNSLKDNYSYIYNFLVNDFKSLKVINKGENIPNDVDTIVIIGGSGLSDYDIFNIDQFLLTGGKAFVALNGVNIKLSQDGISAKDNDSKLIDLFSHYGIKIGKNIVGDIEYFTPVTQGEGALAKQFRYPMWPRIKKENFNKKNPIVKNLSRLNLFWPSSIEFDDTIKDNIEILFHTTENSIVQSKKYKLEIEDFMQEIYIKDKKVRVLALAFRGKIRSFFENKDISMLTKNMTSKNFIKSGETKIVVVSNEYFVANNFMQDNEKNFFLNSVDWLSDEHSLIEIRNKGKFLRPLDKGNREDFQIKRGLVIIFNTFIIPLFILLFGIYLFTERRIKNKKVLEKFNTKDRGKE